MKKLLVMLLVGCTTTLLLVGCREDTTKVEKILGKGSSCVYMRDAGVMCVKDNKPYICYVQSNDGPRTFCFEAIDAYDLR